MLVGPMKKKVITTGVVAALIPIIILGVVGFFVFSNFNKQIATLKAQQTNAERYVLAKDVIANHVIVASDLKLAEVKEMYVPADSYTVYKDNSGKILSDDKFSIIGRRLKVGALENTVLTDSMFYEDDKEPTMDLRLQEFNMISLPSDLTENDYIDVRVRFASGEDYSVLIGKRVMSQTENTIFLKLTEDEIVTIGSAILEAYMNEGTKLYANKYVDPANQLFDYRKVDYVARYNAAINDILTLAYKEQNPEATEEEIKTYLVTADSTDINIDEIASRIGLTVDETQEIKDAIKNNTKDILDAYRNKEVVLDRKIVRTYPVKPGVLALITANPNIVDEVKASFNTADLVSQRLAMTTIDVDALLPDERETIYGKIKAEVEKEIETQKQERIDYLKSLISEE